MYVLGSNDGSLQEGSGFNSQTCLHVCMQALCLCVSVCVCSLAQHDGGPDERQRPPDQRLAVAAGGAAAREDGPREDESEEEGEKESKTWL